MEVLLPQARQLLGLLPEGALSTQKSPETTFLGEGPQRGLPALMGWGVGAEHRRDLQDTCLPADSTLFIVSHVVTRDQTARMLESFKNKDTKGSLLDTT